MQGSSTTVPIAADVTTSGWQRQLIPAGTGLVLAVVFTLGAGVVAGLVTGAGAYLGLRALLRFLDRSQRLEFLVGGGRLEVKGDPLFSEPFSLWEMEIERSEALDLSRKGPRSLRWKTFGTGMPGYYSGEYLLRNGESVLVFISDKRRVLYLPRKKAPALLLSVADPAAFRELLLAARSEAA